MNTAQRTPLLKSFRNRLDIANDQLCFSAFYAYEASQLVSAKAAKQPDSFTSEVFDRNPFSSRIHRCMNDMANFQTEFLAQASATALHVGVETLLAYMSAVRSHSSSLHGGEASSMGNPEEEELLKHLQDVSCILEKELFDTTSYLRRRRNHLVHMLADPTNEMKRFWNKGACFVTDFWSKRPAQLFDFDFFSQDLAEFTIEDGFAIMNILRIIMSDIDRAIASSLPQDAVLKEVTHRTVDRSKHLLGNHGRLIRKIRALAVLEYGLDLDEKSYPDSAISVAIEAY
ncbi:hypothetical protein [Ascidiaceihabitans sp.]|uniref:hypothetical protein n=1 Tax=Ascidiaceihabitans sp. TaxID=1872644 RepID=UPI0032989C24